MPGAIPLHGYPTSTTGQGEGGAARVASSSAGLNVAFPENVSFFVWLVIIGVLVPALVIGGLKAGRFQFVFRGR
jgi:hypothetical protein